eukprot:TRINITY_DN25596_c1_g1_i1.p1 TRINITY_DN25596_c1_g1~~TRINITY_DN25596_c1_g1_i1.p1  ORF type:complete len:129 (-),score=5.93 TRINITY_DN25596_c1_g1_i1:47-379(-)
MAYVGHPTQIAPYKPSHCIDTRSIECSSRHNLHPQEMHYPKYSHSARIQPYPPQYIEPISFNVCCYPVVYGNEGPSSYYSFYSPYPLMSAFPQYLYPVDQQVITGLQTTQ